MLVDEVKEITLAGGHGGPGKVSFYPKEGAGPDGGNGGRGGDLYIQVDSDLYGLNKFLTRNVIRAENGVAGDSNRKFGRDGNDMTITMPVGTVLADIDSEEEIALVNLGEKILIAKGGLGGRGNFTFKSSRNTTPMYAQKGLPGTEKKFKVKLKLIADYGLIGLPNAGKSSLLNEITNANAKIGAYPFTTLEPNLGMLNGKVIADIPGLIEGASEGKGLGIKFLKHIEKVTLLLHCITTESEDPKADYNIVREELKKYNPELLEKEEIILLTKSDLVEERELNNKLKELKKLKRKVVALSIHNWDSIQELSKILQ